jgi:hypothetical protein
LFSRVIQTSGDSTYGHHALGPGVPDLTDIRELHDRWLMEPAYRAEFEALEGEFEHARGIIGHSDAEIDVVIEEAIKRCP